MLKNILRPIKIFVLLLMVSLIAAACGGSIPTPEPTQEQKERFNTFVEEKKKQKLEETNTMAPIKKRFHGRDSALLGVVKDSKTINLKIGMDIYICFA